MTVASENTLAGSRTIPPQRHRDPFVSGNGVHVSNRGPASNGAFTQKVPKTGRNRREIPHTEAFRARTTGTDRISRFNRTKPKRISPSLRSQADSRRLVVRRRARMPATFPIYRGLYHHAVARGAAKRPVVRRSGEQTGTGSTQRAVLRNFGRVSLRPYEAPNLDLALTHERDIAWPHELAQSNVYAITIRSDRWNRMASRLGDWAKHVKRFPGTNGRTINPRVWYQQKKLALKQMKRGRIGCYDSHVRVWKTIQQSGAPFALVLEDDADIRYSAQHASRIQEVLDTLQGRTGRSHGTTHPWDVVLLGHYNDRNYTQGLGNGLTKATKWQPMHAYLISQSGVQKLLKNAWPIRHALDVYVGSELKKGLIMYRLDPRLCGQLHFGHDTEAIK